LLKAEDVWRLQAGGESEFGVQVGLQGASGETVEDDDTNTAAIAAVVALVAVAAGFAPKLRKEQRDD
jgi:hypothetical protein